MRRLDIPSLRSAAVAVLVVLFALGLARNGSSQTFPTMNPGYSTYVSYTTDGAYVYTSVQVSGVTNGTCPSQPAYLVNECHSTTHTPKAYNLLGGVGGWLSGNATAWNSWLSITNSQQVAFNPRSVYTFSYTSEVECSFIGSAVYYLSGGLSIDPSVWIGRLTASTQLTCYYTQACPNDSSPSCSPSIFALDISLGLTCPNYMEEDDLYVEHNGVKVCTGLGYKFGLDGDPPNCE
jgi:hypothetical protein